MRTRNTRTSTLLAFLLASGVLFGGPYGGSMLGGSAFAEECEFDDETVQLILEAGSDIETIESNYGLQVVDSLEPSFLMDLPDGLTAEQAVVLLNADPLVREAELAYRSETPEGIGQMMVGAVGGTFAEFVDQSIADRIHLDAAHVHTTGSGLLVAVIDTGVRADHEAISSNIDPNGYDFVDNDNDPHDEASGFDEDGDGLVDDAAGHGTMVAGIVHLTAPDATLLPIRVLDDEGRGLTFQVAKGIRYAVDQGAHIINLSLGLDCESAIIREELQTAAAAGIHLVAAAGNDGTDESPFYPASDPTVLSVAALDSVDVRADFSSYHSTVAISAPGVGVYAPFHDGEYAVGAGTSFAAPFVSGQIALIRSADPTLTRDDVESVAQAGVEDIYSLPGNQPYIGQLGSGRVDAFETWEQTLIASDVDPVPSVLAHGIRIRPNPAIAGSPVRFQQSLNPQAAAAGLGLRIVDANGRLVRTLDGALSPQGPPRGTSSGADHGTQWEAHWDGLDDAGRAPAAGVYWVTMSHGSPTNSATKLILVR